jgi:hypothetical protein
MKMIWLILIIPLVFVIGMLTYAIIDDVVDENYSFALISYGVSEGCNYYNQTFTDCYFNSLINIDNKLISDSDKQ